MRSRFALFALLLFVSTSAFAHSKPKIMVPAPDAVVAAPPEISVVFSEALDPKFSSLSLLDAKGATVVTGKMVANPSNHLLLTLPLPKLAPGTYRVHWVSAALDGHKADGTYSFKVK